MSNTPTAEEFLRALPPVLRNNSRMIALGQVVAEELSDRMSEIEKAAIYPRIDELDETLLDILAYDFKVDWYGYDYPLETKRALLKSSFYIHRHLGTKGAVEAAIQSVYPKSIVEEWFDYVEGRQPLYFPHCVGRIDPRRAGEQHRPFEGGKPVQKSAQPSGRHHVPQHTPFRDPHRLRMVRVHGPPVRYLSGAGQGGSYLQFSCSCLLYTSPSPRDRG